jgi:hypothetical protein
MSRVPNQRGAGKGGVAVLWHAGRAWPALPEHYLQLRHLLEPLAQNAERL